MLSRADRPRPASAVLGDDHRAGLAGRVRVCAADPGARGDRPARHKQAYLDRYALPDKAHTPLAREEQWPVPYWDIDTGFGVMLILLTAVELGLAALFFGIFQGEQALMDALGVPEGYRPIGAIAMGYPTLGSAPGPRWRPAVATSMRLSGGSDGDRYLRLGGVDPQWAVRADQDDQPVRPHGPRGWCRVSDDRGRWRTVRRGGRSGVFVAGGAFATDGRPEVVPARWSPPSSRASRASRPGGADDGVDNRSPRPTPPPSELRSGPARRNGSSRPPTAPGSRTGPVLITSRTPVLILPRCHPHEATGKVVADGIFDQVAGQPFEQTRIPAHHHRFEIGDEGDTGRRRLDIRMIDHPGHRLGQLYLGPVFDVPLGAGQEEEGLDEMLGFLVVRPELFQDRP